MAPPVGRDMAADGAPEATPRRAAADWQSLVGRMAERLAHEIRNPLNGAMVNLQVVASRAGRLNQDAAALAPFANAATAELERAAALTESLLAVLRPPRAGEDVAVALHALLRVYSVITARGGSLEFLGDDTVDSRTTVEPRKVRVALAAVIDAAVEQGGEVTARLRHQGGAVIVEVRRAGQLAHPRTELAALLADVGIRCGLSPDEYVLIFPAVQADADD
jgi:signal transduction histidine kinase